MYICDAFRQKTSATVTDYFLALAIFGDVTKIEMVAMASSHLSLSLMLSR